MRKNTVKQALTEGKLQLGTGFGQLRSPEVAKILAAAGFQWAFLDAEHGGFDLETLQDICGTAVMVGLSPIVRVADLQYSLIARALDCGAQGVIFPRVESVELLQRAISWTKFPPVGVRGYGLGATQLEYEKASFPQVIEHMNANTMVVMQIETQRALDMQELLSVPGIDAVMVWTGGSVDFVRRAGRVRSSENDRRDRSNSRYLRAARRRARNANTHSRSGKILEAARNDISGCMNTVMLF